MASRAWSPDELQILEEHAGDVDWQDAIIERLPDRTMTAVNVQICRVRRRLGLKPRRGMKPEEDQDSMNAKSVEASQRLLEATLRVGVWA